MRFGSKFQLQDIIRFRLTVYKRSGPQTIPADTSTTTPRVHKSVLENKYSKYRKSQLKKIQLNYNKIGSLLLDESLEQEQQINKNTPLQAISSWTTGQGVLFKLNKNSWTEKNFTLFE